MPDNGPDDTEANQVSEGRKEAIKTYIEQTKLLVSLASAFIFAPAAAQAVLDLTIDTNIVIAEILFVVSVLASYFVLATITGSQHKGEFNVNRPATRVTSLIQFFSYIAGLAFFIRWLTSQAERQ